MTLTTHPQAGRCNVRRSLRPFVEHAARAGLVIDSDGMSLADALTRGGLGYRVVLGARTFAEEDTPLGVVTTPMRERSLIRVDLDGTRTGLATVLGRYQVVQNLDAFGFLQALIDDQQANIVAVSAYGEPVGIRAFVAMHTPQPILAADGSDLLDMFLVARNSHDGNSQFTTSIVPVRRADGTIIDTAMARAPQTWKVTHSGDINGKLAEGAKTMARVRAWANEYTKVSSRMLAARITADEFRDVTHQLLPTPAGATDRSADTWAERRATLMGLFRNAPDTNYGGGTVYAAFNAICAYVDHHAPGKVNAVAARHARIVKGDAARLKHRGWQLLARRI